MYLGAIYIFPRSVLLGISFTLKAKKKFTSRINLFPFMICNFPNWKFVCWSFIWLCAPPQKRRGGHGTGPIHWLAAVPCPTLHSCGWAERYLTQYSKIEILDKTFTSDSHRPFMCSAVSHWRVCLLQCMLLAELKRRGNRKGPLFQKCTTGKESHW
jgi:hypothetical protein